MFIYRRASSDFWLEGICPQLELQGVDWVYRWVDWVYKWVDLVD